MQTIDSAVEIQASPAAVWQVFTDPEVSRQMGGEFVSDWTPGASFGWHSNIGEMITSGRILDVDPGKLLRVELYAGSSNLVTSVVTYRLSEEGGATSLLVIEELRRPVGDEEYANAVQDWQALLAAVKELAEKL